jgi:hypothetical protein
MVSAVFRFQKGIKLRSRNQGWRIFEIKNENHNFFEFYWVYLIWRRRTNNPSNMESSKTLN